MTTAFVSGYDPGVSSLLEDGWVLRCGNCARRLVTDFAPRSHRVFDDLSGRCFVPENDGVVVSTFFFADPRESKPAPMRTLVTGEMVDDLVEFWHTRCHMVDGRLVALDAAARDFLERQLAGELEQDPVTVVGVPGQMHLELEAGYTYQTRPDGSVAYDSREGTT